MDFSTADTTTLSYTTAGRHRRDIGPGRIRLTVRGSGADASSDTRPDAETPTVLVNGFAVPVRFGETVIQVPAGPMLVEVSWARTSRPLAVEFVLGEGHVADVHFTVPRLGLGAGKIQLAGVHAPAA